MGKRSFLQDLGFGIAPLYGGEQVSGPGSHHSSSAKGTTDGNDAVGKMRSEGFAPGSCVYLDLENGPSENGPAVPQVQRDYLNSFCNAVTAGGFLPGVYCLHGLAAEIHALQPAARIWAVKVSNATSRPGHFVPGPNYPNGDPAVASGVPGAFVVQLHQNCEISVEGVAMHLHPVDLDSARTADPGAPAATSGPVA